LVKNPIIEVKVDEQEVKLLHKWRDD
jgi:hypothetical protein